MQSTGDETLVGIIEDHISLFEEWVERYREASNHDSKADLLAIGRHISQWLLQAGWLWLIVGGKGPIELDIDVVDPHSESGGAFLDVPWELLSGETGFLARNVRRPLCVRRRFVPETGQNMAPKKRVSVLYASALARNSQHPIDFETERQFILNGTWDKSLRLCWEGSGCLEVIGERLQGADSFNVLHISANGSICEGLPILHLVDEKQDHKPANAIDLIETIIPRMPELIVLSACSSAERGSNTPSLAACLALAGVPGVIGFDGPLAEKDAHVFAQILYRELGSFKAPDYAVAKARYTLLSLQENDPHFGVGRDWHRARLYVNPDSESVTAKPHLEMGERRAA